MDLLLVLLSTSTIIYVRSSPASAFGQTPQSHWCPSLEVRRISCVKNVSLGGEPAGLRRVFQWKKELVMRCCPGFMGPNCEKACFSCQQWADIVGKLHHMEKYLEQGVASGSSRRFQPFTPDPSANTVCWTKDGRPMYGHVAPPDITGGEEMPDRRRGVEDGGKAGGGGRGGQEIERSRIYVRKGAKQAPKYGFGCPIHSKGPYYDYNYNHNDDESRVSPYHSTQDARQERSPRRQQRVSISVDARGTRQVSSYGRKSLSPKSAHPPYYQKHPPLFADRKSLVSNANAKARGPGVLQSQASSGRSSKASTPMSAMKQQIIRRRSDVTDEDIADIRRRYSKTQRSHTDDYSAYDNRLSILERQMVDLERKLSALLPTLATVGSMKDQISHLTTQIETLQTTLDVTSNGKFQDLTGQDQSSIRKRAPVEQREKSEPGTYIKEPQRLTRDNDGKEDKNDRIEVQNPNSSFKKIPWTRPNGSSPGCKTQCNDHSPPPTLPLPDKEVVEALFPDSPRVAQALKKGPEEFYQEVKKATEEKRNRGQETDQGQFSDIPMRDSDEYGHQKRGDLRNNGQESQQGTNAGKKDIISFHTQMESRNRSNHGDLLVASKAGIIALYIITLFFIYLDPVSWR